MNEEPTTTPIPEDDNLPSTKGFVRQEIDKLAQATQQGFDEIRSEMQKSEKRIINEFKVVAENIHKDVAGAGQDAVDLLNNQVPDHEDRIIDLEKHAGLSVGPRFEHIK